MATSKSSQMKTPGPLGRNDGAHPLCSKRGDTPGPLGTGSDHASTNTNPKSSKNIKVLGFDAAKVRDLFFKVGYWEEMWQLLNANLDAPINETELRAKADARAALLFDWFLQASSKGPQAAIQFLAAQHNILNHNLRLTQVLLNQQEQRIADHQLFLSKVAFGAQLVASGADVALAIGALFLAPVPALLLGVGYEGSLKIIKSLDSTGNANADAVTIGFGQKVYNEVATFAGELQKSSNEALAEKLQQALAFPNKSSVYRDAASTASQLDKLLKILQVVKVSATVYTNYNIVMQSYAQLKAAQQDDHRTATQLNSQRDIPKQVP